MRVFNRTQQLIWHAEALVLFGQFAADRVLPFFFRRKKSNRTILDFVYRIACTLMCLVKGFIAVAVGYAIWTVCFALFYLVLLILVGVLGAVLGFTQAEVLNSSLFNWSMVLIFVSFIFLPPLSVYSDSGVKRRDLAAICRKLQEIEAIDQEDMDDLRESMKVREQRVGEWLKIPRWISAVLWILFLFLLQSLVRDLLAGSVVSSGDYRDLLVGSGLAALTGFLVVHSYAAITDRILKTVHFSLIEYSSQIRCRDKTYR